MAEIVKCSSSPRQLDLSDEQKNAPALESERRRLINATVTTAYKKKGRQADAKLEARDGQVCFDAAATCMRRGKAATAKDQQPPQLPSLHQNSAESQQSFKRTTGTKGIALRDISHVGMTHATVIVGQEAATEQCDGKTANSSHDRDDDVATDQFLDAEVRANYLAMAVATVVPNLWTPQAGQSKSLNASKPASRTACERRCGTDGFCDPSDPLGCGGEFCGLSNMSGD